MQARSRSRVRGPLLEPERSAPFFQSAPRTGSCQLRASRPTTASGRRIGIAGVESSSADAVRTISKAVSRTGGHALTIQRKSAKRSSFMPLPTSSNHYAWLDMVGCFDCSGSWRTTSAVCILLGGAMERDLVLGDVGTGRLAQR